MSYSNSASPFYGPSRARRNGTWSQVPAIPRQHFRLIAIAQRPDPAPISASAVLGLLSRPSGTFVHEGQRFWATHVTSLETVKSKKGIFDQALDG
jgi:hypothetical protein